MVADSFAPRRISPSVRLRPRAFAAGVGGFVGVSAWPTVAQATTGFDSSSDAGWTGGRP